MAIDSLLPVWEFEVPSVVYLSTIQLGLGEVQPAHSYKNHKMNGIV